MSAEPSDLVAPTEQERARMAAILGAVLGVLLVVSARSRRR
jgi:hypothetical protein